MSTTQRTRIQNALIEMTKDWHFHPVVYDKTTGAASVTVSENITPATVLANETQSTFAPDLKMGRRQIRKRNNWTFQLIVKFHQEVSVTEFEEFLINPGLPFLTHDEVNNLLPVTLNLMRCDVFHPQQQQSRIGTEATLTFEALVGRN